MRSSIDRSLYVALVLSGTCLLLTASAAPPRQHATRTGGSDAPATQSALDTQSGPRDTVWVNAHTVNRCPGAPHRGGEGTGGPDGFETWCFEGGPGDSTSDGRPGGYVFTSFDRRGLRDHNDSLYWHADTFQAIAGRSMWCGGWNDRSGSWVGTIGGYGNDWQQIMQLTLAGPFDATRGCSLRFQARYVLECNYDYAYLEYYSFRRSQWRAVDLFNGKSGCTVISATKVCQPDWNNYRSHWLCPGLPHGAAVSYPGPMTAGAARDFPAYPYVAGNSWVLIRGDSISATPSAIPEIRFRWRVATDRYESAADGGTALRGFLLDDVAMKVGAFSYSENFDAVPVGGLPGAPYSFPNLEPIYDGWAIRYDLDPPFEGIVYPGPGDSGMPQMCKVNASWQWSLRPSETLIPPPIYGTHLPGYDVILAAPAIPLDYADEEGGPFARTGVVVQYDQFQRFDEITCDYQQEYVRSHLPSGIGAWSGIGVWRPWQLVDGFWIGSGTFHNMNVWDDLTPFIAAGADSVQLGWISFDLGGPGAHCWNPTLPPHIESQALVDNVSVGIFDAGAPTVYAEFRAEFFQDTFNVRSCLHTASVANADLGYGQYLLHDADESLGYDITDPDGLAPGDVRLHYSYDRFATEAPGSPVAMNLSEPYIPDPASGGEWRATICDTPWVPGTEVSYYIEIEDGLGNVVYIPASAAPLASPRLFHHVEILPTPGARILLVDDNRRSAPSYHPCRQDTTMLLTEDFYENVLRDLGYGYMAPGGYDLYDGAGFTWGISEPWGFWVADPANPDSGERAYDVVIWTTGAHENFHTIQDTTQTFLKEFVFHGGRVLVTGDLIGYDLFYSSAAEDPDFYGNLLGAEYAGYHSYWSAPDRFPTSPSLSPGVFLAPGESLHVYAGCDPPRGGMDRIRLKTAGLPAWSHPSPYLIYDDTTAPYDSVAGIYNWITATSDTGLVVYLPFSLDAVVDHHDVTCDPPYSPFGDVGLGTFQGQAELLADVLGIFGAAPRTSVSAMSSGALIDALRPVSPNPVQRDCAVNFSLAAAAPVDVAIFDVSGRRIATLVDREMPAGEHAARWSGRDHHGQQVAPGVYFARITTPRFRATAKMLLLE